MILNTLESIKLMQNKPPHIEKKYGLFLPKKAIIPIATSKMNKERKRIKDTFVLSLINVTSLDKPKTIKIANKYQADPV